MVIYCECGLLLNPKCVDQVCGFNKKCEIHIHNISVLYV